MSESVAILGLGTMGSGMAANLLKAGVSLTVYNRTPAKAQALVSTGARFAATPAAAAKDTSIVIGMLADDTASRAVWTGKDGVLNTVRPGTVLIESSTASPAWIEELAGLAAQHGTELLDAPVTGSRVQAATGQLTFLVGGSEAALQAATSVLKCMSKEIVHLGPTGSGAKMKLINNFLCGVQVASLAEGLAWVERSGLDTLKAVSILNAGAPASPLLGAVSERMINQNYAVNFLLTLMAKDMRYAQTEAANCNVNLTTAEVSLALFERAIANGYGDQDMASVIEPLRANK